MKVCFISYEYAPFIDGGAGVYARELTKSLTQLGCEIHVITRTLEKKITYSYENEIHVHRLPFINRPGFVYSSFVMSLMAFFRTLIRRIGSIDILHSNDYSFFPSNRSIRCVPKVTTIHHLFSSYPKRVGGRFYSRFKELTTEYGSIIPFIQKRVILASDIVIAVSNSTRKIILEKLPLNSSQVITIYNGHDSQQTSNDPEDSERKMMKYFNNIKESGQSLILYVGRIDDQRKNLPFLLNAVERVINSHHKNVNLLLVGKGDSTDVQQQGKRLGIQHNIHITGYVSDACLNTFYSLCDVFVLPSLQEGFGLALLEAMGHGKPVISTRVGGVVEFLKHGKTGYLIEVGDVDNLADSILNIINNPGIAKEFGKFNKSYVTKHFSWKKCAKETFVLYERLSK